MFFIEYQSGTVDEYEEKEYLSWKEMIEEIEEEYDIEMTNDWTCFVYD